MPARCTASSNSLSDFAIDVDYHLEDTELLRVVKVKKTGEPRCALIFECIALQGGPDGEAIANAIERVWREAPLGYDGAEDFIQTEVGPDRVTATFLAQADEIGTITGRIDVLFQVATKRYPPRRGKWKGRLTRA